MHINGTCLGMYNALRMWRGLGKRDENVYQNYSSDVCLYMNIKSGATLSDGTKNLEAFIP